MIISPPWQKKIMARQLRVRDTKRNRKRRSTTIYQPTLTEHSNTTAEKPSRIIIPANHSLAGGEREW
jgi:hypothetical protein